ncbi:MAG: GTPase Era [Candidatus Eisenbacteria bacterium]
MSGCSSADFRCGYVAVVGRPNVGKSTLVNKLLNFPLSIVTSKPQTTRHKMLGILNEDGYQVIFLDSPGLVKPKYALQDLMVRSAWSAIEEADLVALMVESRVPEIDRETDVLKRLKSLNKTVILVVNKIDLVTKSDLLPIIKHYSDLFPFKDVIPVSALKDDGLDVLKQAIVSNLPARPPYYPPEDLTDRPQKFFVSEIIRQKVFEQFGEEIPYSVAVIVDEYKERESDKDYIRAIMICERDSQKGMLIGKGAKALKRLGSAARSEIESFVGKSVYLELKVEVRKKWRKHEDTIRRLGQV